MPTFDPSRVERIPIENREQWLALRLSDITASDVAAACGLSTFKSPLRLFAEKTGTITSDTETGVMRRGRWFEPAIEAALREERPTWSIRKASVYLRDPVNRLGATPDFVAVAPDREGLGLVQAKTVARSTFARKWSGDDEGEFTAATPRAPLDYQLQTLVEAKLAGASWAVVAALVVGEFSADLHVIEVDLHDGAFRRILGEVEFFWSRVSSGSPPPLNPSLDALTVAKLYRVEDPDLDERDLSSDAELLALLEERDRRKAEASAASVRAAEIETVVRHRLGNHSRAVAGDFSIAWTLQERRGHFVEASTSRVLRITKRKAKSAKPAKPIDNGKF